VAVSIQVGCTCRDAVRRARAVADASAGGCATGWNEALKKYQDRWRLRAVVPADERHFLAEDSCFFQLGRDQVGGGGAIWFQTINSGLDVVRCRFDICVTNGDGGAI
jgi:hypothetical protein